MEKDAVIRCWCSLGGHMARNAWGFPLGAEDLGISLVGTGCFRPLKAHAIVEFNPLLGSRHAKLWYSVQRLRLSVRTIKKSKSIFCTDSFIVSSGRLNIKSSAQLPARETASRILT